MSFILPENLTNMSAWSIVPGISVCENLLCENYIFRFHIIYKYFHTLQSIYIICLKNEALICV